MTSMADKIRKGRDTLFVNGWCQGHYADIDDRRCVRGSVLGEMRCGVEWESVSVVWQLMDQVAKEEGYGGATLFNDAPRRTFSEVIDFMDLCEKRAEACS